MNFYSTLDSLQKIIYAARLLDKAKSVLKSSLTTTAYTRFNTAFIYENPKSGRSKSPDTPDEFDRSYFAGSRFNFL
jgi:hypothetical protein